MIRGQDKITRTHRERLAYVYVRQSSATQVRQNLESQRRQYELRDSVQEMGWHPENIVVLDEDLGRTADGTRGRAGFLKLRAQVCEGRVGLIMSLETSRLARNNREWYHLLDVCTVYGTLVAEPGGIYDPREYDDRLHLGLKGILSEAELHILKSRLVAGARHKAERGELFMKLPVGLVADEDGKVVLDPDRNVQHTLRSIFEKFRDVGSVRKVYRWMVGNGVKLPRRVGSGLFSEVVWNPPTYAALEDVFQNPRYSGTYVFGRSETCVSVKETEPRRSRRLLPIEKWKVIIPGAHPGYISWEEFLRNRERIRQNYVGKRDGKGAPGRGRAHLQGLVRCGRCSFRMQVHYRTKPGAGPERTEELSYRCGRAQAQHLAPFCQTVSARIVDHVVAEAFLAVLKPAQLEVTLESLRQLDESSKSAERHWELKLERARYEVERSKRQYDRVEPEDRLVAGELERRWEEKLRDLKRAEDEYARWKQEKKAAWSEGQVEELRALVKDVGSLWEAETTTNEDRKELLRLLIDEVWISANKPKREVEVRIVWKGGSQTVHRGAWWTNGRGIRNEAIARIREMSVQGLLDAAIARRLNEEGLRRCDGTAFTDDTVRQIRCNKGIPKAPPPRELDTYNLQETAKMLGVDVVSIYNWIRAGILEAAPVDGYGERKVRLTKETLARLTGGWDRENELDVKQAAELLGIPVSRVRNMVDDGRLKPRRAVFGRRVRLLFSRQELQARKVRVQNDFKPNVKEEV